MIKIIHYAAYFIVFVLIFPIFALAESIPDTGQTKCYDSNGEIPCPQTDQNLYGQDGHYTINAPSYTKLDASGNDLPDDALKWVMVRDNVTGLIWEVKTDDGSAHDKDNKYTWYDSNPETNGGYAGTPGDGTDTEDFINALNSTNFGGFFDWRLPSRKELQSIVNFGRSQPSIDTAYFPRTVAEYYWSSDTYAYSADIAWHVSFFYGLDLTLTLDNFYKSYSYYVRAVRGGY